MKEEVTEDWRTLQDEWNPLIMVYLTTLSIAQQI
jgi:hypothetical protein